MSTLLCFFLAVLFFFFFNDTATTEIYTLSLHDALPIYADAVPRRRARRRVRGGRPAPRVDGGARRAGDRKSTRLNSSHLGISYAVFCLKKKKKKQTTLSILMNIIVDTLCVDIWLADQTE